MLLSCRSGNGTTVARNPSLHLIRLGHAGWARIALVAGVWAATMCLVALLFRTGALAGSLAQLARVDATSIGLAGSGILLGLIATANAWRITFNACGASLGRLDACARYGVGSLGNSLLPARLGDGVRAALFAQSLPPGRSRVLVAGGGLGAIAIIRLAAHIGLFAIAVALGALPARPVTLVALGTGLLAAGVVAVGRRRRGPRVAGLFRAAAALLADPEQGVRVAVWTLGATLARMAAAATVLAAIGIPSPLLSALVVTAALELAGLVPLTPGNVGITSGAVAAALGARGVDLSSGVAAGVVFHAVELSVGLSFGLASLPLGIRPRLRSSRAARYASTAMFALLPGLTGAALLVDMA